MSKFKEQSTTIKGSLDDHSNIMKQKSYTSDNKKSTSQIEVDLDHINLRRKENPTKNLTNLRLNRNKALTLKAESKHSKITSMTFDFKNNEENSTNVHETSVKMQDLNVINFDRDIVEKYKVSSIKNGQAIDILRGR